MYESQRMRQKWFSLLGDEPEQTEEEQDSIKVNFHKYRERITNNDTATLTTPLLKVPFK